MTEQELKQKIKQLEGYIKKEDVESLSILLNIIIVSVSIMAGGLILGALFKQLALAILSVISICVVTQATNIKMYEELRENLKHYRNQIAVYNKEISEIQKRSQVPKPEKKETSKKEVKYEYKKAAEKQKNQSKQKEIIIETFDESDFLDEPQKSSNKKH